MDRERIRESSTKKLIPAPRAEKSVTPGSWEKLYCVVLWRGTGRAQTLLRKKRKRMGSFEDSIIYQRQKIALYKTSVLEDKEAKVLACGESSIHS